MSGVFPAEGFIARQLRVEVSGDATNWSDSTTVSFGPDVTVTAINVASPTDLFADITIKDSAAEGLTDVTVTDGNQATVLSQAFKIKSPVEVTVQGTIAQGSVAFVTLKNKDLDNLFDATDDGSGTFPNIVFTSPNGTEVQLSNVTPFQIDAVLLMDINAEAGALSLASGTADAALNTPVQDLNVVARAPIALTAGTPADGLQKDGYGTELYQFTPGTAPTLTRAAVTGGATARVIVVPSSGRVAEFLTITADFEQLDLTALTSDTYYLVFFDNTGTSGYNYTITPNNVNFATVVNEVATANQTGAQAQNLTAAPAILNNATITGATDIDFIKFTVGPNDVNKKVHVITTGGQFTDTIVDVYTNAAATTTLGESDDLGFQENFLSDPIPANTQTIFVRIAASPGWATDFTTTPNYIAAIFLE